MMVWAEIYQQQKREVINIQILEINMQTRYQNLLDQLHTNKRQLANYRQKYLSLQSQLLTLQQQSRTFKKTISSQKQTIEKLNQQNKSILTEKQAILNEYSTSVESIKQEITRKQHQIYVLKENSFSPITNQKLLEKQLRCEIETQFEEQLQGKEKRIRELSEQLNKVNFDKAVDREKYQLKLQSLEKELKEMQNSHMIQLQNYANRTYQNSQSTKTSQQQVLIKKLRRQIDELRISLDSTKQQLHESINQKTKLQKQHSSFVNKHTKQVQKYAQQLRVLQFDNERYHSSVNKQKPQRDQYLVKEKEKEKQIKSLKDKVQQLHDKLTRINSKYSQLQVQLVNKENQLKKHKEFTHKHQNQKISSLKTQNQTYKRQLYELKLINQNVRKQNLQLMNSFSDINIKSFHNINTRESANNNRESANYNNAQQNANYNSNTTRISRERKENHLTVTQNNSNTYSNHLSGQKHNHKSKPSIIDEYQENQQLENSFGNLHKAKSSTNLRTQTLSKLQLFKNHYQKQCHKNQQLASKYIELKKKYKHLQDKFNQANNKLMELLKDKIQLNSPTAASQKSFQFPTSPQHKFIISPQPLSHNNTREPHENIHFSKTQGNVNPLRGLHFSPEFTIAKAKRAQRSESQTKTGDQSFYQKSLKIKNSHKFRQIKCLNHDDPQHDHTYCSHSPLK